MQDDVRGLGASIPQFILDRGMRGFIVLLKLNTNIFIHKKCVRSTNS